MPEKPQSGTVRGRTKPPWFHHTSASVTYCELKDCNDAFLVHKGSEMWERSWLVKEKPRLGLGHAREESYDVLTADVPSTVTMPSVFVLPARSTASR